MWLLQLFHEIMDVYSKKMWIDTIEINNQDMSSQKIPKLW